MKPQRLLILLLLAGCGDTAGPAEERDPITPMEIPTGSDVRFDAEVLRLLETATRPENKPCKANVDVRLEGAEFSKVESYGYDVDGNIHFLIDITAEGPQEKKIAFFDQGLVQSRVVYNYKSDAPTEYITYDYDAQDRLTRMMTYRLTIDTETLEWVPEPQPMKVIEHGYPTRNEWRYNDAGVLHTATWDAEARVLTTIQGLTVNRAFLDSDVTLPELTRLGTHLTPADWTAEMDRGEVDQDGDGEIDFMLDYVYESGHLVHVTDNTSVDFEYLYSCEE